MASALLTQLRIFGADLVGAGKRDWEGKALSLPAHRRQHGHGFAVCLRASLVKIGK